MNLFEELHREGATICMVTHDPRYAGMADRSIHLVDGRITEETVATRAEVTQSHLRMGALPTFLYSYASNVRLRRHPAGRRTKTESLARRIYMESSKHTMRVSLRDAKCCKPRQHYRCCP